jgi:polysaccharide export outer membrane protein
MIGKGYVFVLGLVLLAGCVGPPLPPYKCAADDIRTGDTLIISLADIPEAIVDKEFVVRTDGTINVPLLQSFPAAGRTFNQLERDLQNGYITNKFYRQITVLVKPGPRSFSVGGEVKQPGRLAYSGEITLMRAIVAAGDFTEFAKRGAVELNRADGTKEIVDCNKARHNSKYDRPVCPGDYINVPRSL